MSSSMAAIVIVVLLLVLPMMPFVRSNLRDIVLYQSESKLNDASDIINSKDPKVDVEDQMIAPTTPREPPPMTEYRRVQDKLLCRSEEQLDTWLRHPANCSRYFVCSGGQVREMKPCSRGQVFSIKTKQCVPVSSALDDCDEMVYSLPTHLRSSANASGGWGQRSRSNGQRLLWHPQYSQIRDATPQLQLTPTPIMGAGFGELYPNAFNPDVGCGPLKSGVFPHPDNCAWYFNCSVRPDAVMETYYGGHVMECPYPQLFSLDSMQCEDFEDVACRGRYEPKSPCDYRANHCHETSHCIPCWVRYASCLGMEDGLNPWPELEWRPFFVECYSQRTVFQGSCDKSSVFSPLTRACETPYSIPREHGGWRPSCHGRRDGKYPDEYGRCESYYACKGQIFTGFHSCSGSTLFDPVTGSCQERSRVPYPCGDQDTPNFCQRKPDGKYLDAHGRCTHYYTCLEGTVAGVFMCPEGVFNPQTRSCDPSSDVISPCGSGHNPCLEKEDGYHRDEIDSSCSRFHLCERGLHVAAFFCGARKTFNDVSQTCSNVTETPLPCGLAPSCKNREDGKYPALNRGLEYYYSCRNSTFSGYSRCSSDEGGLAFSALRRECDTPVSVCVEVTGNIELCR